MKRFVWQLVLACTAASALMAQQSSTPPAKKPRTQQGAKVDKQLPKAQPPISGGEAKKKNTGRKEPKQPKKDDRIRLIVRGDDFGSTHASNLALEEAFSDSIMKSAGVMVPGPWFKETAAIVREHPEWCVGVHLTLNSDWGRFRWRPVLPISEVPSLVAADGFMYMNHWLTGETIIAQLEAAQRAEYVDLTTSDPPDPTQVENELRAQIRVAQSRGIRIDYLDCHMRTASTGPFLPIVRKLAQELCVPIPEEGLMGEHRIRIIWDRKTTESAKQGLKKLLDSLSPGLWKLVGYPVHDTPELRAVDAIWGPRKAQERTALFQAWKDPEIKRFIAQKGIKLVSIRDLWDYEKCEPK